MRRPSGPLPPAQPPQVPSPVPAAPRSQPVAPVVPAPVALPPVVPAPVVQPPVVATPAAPVLHPTNEPAERSAQPSVPEPDAPATPNEVEPDAAVTAPIPIFRPTEPLTAEPTAVPDPRSDAPEADAFGGESSPAAPTLSVRQARRERRRVERRELKRFTADRRRRRRNWIIGVGSVLGVGAVILAVAYSPLMALRTIRVEGASKVPVAELQQALSGKLGTPLPLLRSGDIESALQRFPLLESYTTEVIPPSTLVVRVVERQPIGVVQSGGGYDVVDAAGVLLDHVGARPAGFAVIEAGDTGGTAFRAAAAVMRSLPADVRAQVVEVSANTADDVRLTLAGNVRVLWGNESDVALKASVLAKLMAAAPPKSVNQYDVSSPLAPTTR